MRRARVAVAAALAVLLAVPLAASSAPALPRRIVGAGSPAVTTAAEIERLKAAGVDTITVDVWWEVDSFVTPTVRPGARTTSDTDLLTVAAAARAAGIRVLLTPKIWCPACARSTWRGHIDPAQPAAFFESYRRMSNHYAELATAAGFWGYYFGSEMDRTEDSVTEWRRVAREARQRFSGPVLYEASWDNAFQVRFWDASTFVSVSAYYPLIKAADPSVETLMRCWNSSCTPEYRGRRWVSELRALARRTGKKVLFGEAGYHSTEYATWRPYMREKGAAVSQRAQANAYRALVRTFRAEPWFLGVIWWEWNPAVDATTDPFYSPRGKTAESLMRL